MTKKKAQQQAPPVEEWSVEEWEKAYEQKCREYNALRECMRQAMQHLAKAV